MDVDNRIARRTGLIGENTQRAATSLPDIGYLTDGSLDGGSRPSTADWYDAPSPAERSLRATLPQPEPSTPGVAGGTPIRAARPPTSPDTATISWHGHTPSGGTNG